MKKIIIFIMTLNMLHASYYEVCKADRQRLYHLVNDKNNIIQKKNREISSLSKQLQQQTVLNNKLRNELERYRNMSGINRTSYNRGMSERQQAKKELQRQITIENQQPNKSQMNSKTYQKNLIWYKRRYEECRASLSVN